MHSGSTVILFGAGASFGSQTHSTPALADQLFDRLAEFDPRGWGRLPIALANEFKNDFERGMESLSLSDPHRMPILQRSMALYFFNFWPSCSNLYYKFARRVRDNGWNGLLVSLNYELLLQLSLIRAGLVPAMERVAAKGEVELCLPHGCCNLFCNGIFADARGVSYSGAGVVFDGAVKPEYDNLRFSQRIRHDAVTPVMSYIQTDKFSSAGSSFLQAARERWRIAVKEAKRILIVGVRLRERDEHIWEPIRQTHAKVIYCAPDLGEFVAWSGHARHGKESTTIEGRFFDCFDEICSSSGC